ncbi:hypothetical protein [Nonomuraea endophytica]|uniref:hypothetical protein n=1 Tax=Nonomuraea endophytica TaxID=714136 RepID=UPI0037CBE7E7
MADLAAFRMNRSAARSASPDKTRFLRLGDGGAFTDQLRNLLGDGKAVDEAARAAVRFFADLPADLRAVLVSEYVSAPPESWYLRLLLRLDDWLTRYGNAPEPAAFDDHLGHLLSRLTDAEDVDLDTFDLGADGAESWALLVDLLCAALLLPENWQSAQRATRLLLVAGLVGTRFDRCKPFESAGQISELLQYRRPLLPSPPFPAVLPQKKVRLVREATVSDLYVIRSEWRCYEAGEIAEIANVLAGEKLEFRRLSIDERELTQVQSDERVSVEEQVEESTERSELAEETQRQVGLAVNANAQITTSGEYASTKVDSVVGGSVDFSVSEAMRRATTLAREAVRKATTRIESRRRSERTERTLSRTEVTDLHVLDNPGPEHVRGVYRWVNRIDRYQVIRYPDRLQLEFQLPEPGNALRRLLSAGDAGMLRDPGEFTVTPDEIDRESWAGLVGAHQVPGVPPPPQEQVVVSAAVFGTTSTPTKGEELWSLAPATAEEEIVLPPGYEAERVTVKLLADPLLGKFVREYTDAVGVGTIDRFHSISVTTSIAGLAEWHWHANGDLDNTIQADMTQRRLATASWELPAENRGPLSRVRDKLPVRITAAGAESVNAAVVVTCTLSPFAFQSWQQTVYDLLLAAHQQAKADYREEQSRLALRRTTTLRERSPARHRQMIREELRRLVLAWLTGQSPFPGRPAVLADGDHPDEHTDVDRALAVATDIQFLEQSFEWQNMVYVCYPYYWARPSEWDELRTLDAADPELAEFLRAGSVRVVVPARPSLQCQVEHWLLYGQRWAGGMCPTPDQPTYISIAQEIRDQLLPPADGEPGESWEVRLPTAFRWLDQEAHLPHNPHPSLGLPPHAPAKPLCHGPEPGP